MNPEYTEVFERFGSDVENHQMTIVRAEGVNRHLRFRRPGCSSYWFDIITWPGVLCINGDMGTYVFSRLEDMFEFFDQESKSCPINPGYWGEKIIAMDKHCGITEFDEPNFERILRLELESAFPGDALAVEQLECDLLDDLGRGWVGRDEAYRIAIEFEYDGKRPFGDIWEYACTRHTFHYIWNCFAIRYAIMRFKEEHANQNNHPE